MEEAKVPKNCTLLVPKHTNTEIWTKLADFTRTNDTKLQDILKVQAPFKTMFLKAPLYFN